jgi:tRNA1(Val) A37 N6-methylase TrmN6
LVDQETLPVDIDPAISVDNLFDGRLVCMQPRRGYRYSVDSLLLAHFLSVENDEFVLDLGCGCGIVGLIILFCRQAGIKGVTGLELQPELAELARRNGKLNGFGSRHTVVEGDLRTIKTLFPAESFSRVVCNPPFYLASSGRKNAERQSLIARHQVCTTTDQVIEAASYAVKNRGKVNIVFPAEGLIELVCSMEKMRLEPKRMQMVFSYPERESNAKLVLVEAIKNGGPGVKIQPPFYIYSEKNGPYSDEMQKMYSLQSCVQND